jgi:hypothetical protein
LTSISELGNPGEQDARFTLVVVIEAEPITMTTTAALTTTSAEPDPRLCLPLDRAERWHQAFRSVIPIVLYRVLRGEKPNPECERRQAGGRSYLAPLMPVVKRRAAVS